jgi:hypothetical protein
MKMIIPSQHELKVRRLFLIALGPFLVFMYMKGTPGADGKPFSKKRWTL